jgi:hypothetical protein
MSDDLCELVRVVRRLVIGRRTASADELRSEFLHEYLRECEEFDAAFAELTAWLAAYDQREEVRADLEFLTSLPDETHNQI